MTPYDYTDYRSYLRDWFWTNKQRNSRLSFRSVSRRLGLKSPNHFHLVISGRRHLSKTLFDKALAMLRLGARERHFLVLLYKLEYALADEKSPLMEQVELLRKGQRSDNLEPEQYRMVAHSLAWNIKMAAPFFEGLRPEQVAETAKRCAMFVINDDQVDEALQILGQVGLMRIDEEGQCRFDDGDITTKWNFESEAVKAHHKGNLNLALQTIPWAIDRRFFTSVTIPCEAGLRAEIIADLRALSMKILESSKAVEACRNSVSHLMTLQVAFFPFFEFPAGSEKKDVTAAVENAPK